MENRKQAAQAHIDRHAAQVNPLYRPHFHMTAPCGWINDPNGLSFWRGQVHLFFQFTPQSDVPGRMHWGHCVSEDMITWRYVGVALAPDTPADSEHCFSGNAVEDAQGNLVLMYTSLRPDGQGGVLQEQSIAVSSDGVEFVKPDENPVISGAQLPPDASRFDFRDPKVVRDGEGYLAIVANRGEKNGRQLIFRSPDLRRWTYRGVFLENIGDMPECPDLFRLDGQDVMITSVIGLPPDGLRFQSHVSDVIYLVGRMEDDRFLPRCMEAVDLGPDFYAPQSVALPDGRRVMIGWMQMWGEDSPTRYLRHGWNGAMTIPREIRLEGDRLRQLPVRELENYRRNHRRWENVPLSGVTVPPGLRGRRYEMDVTLALPENGQAEIRLLQTGDEYFVVHYNAKTHVLTTDRSRCGWSMGREGLWEEKPGGRAVVPGGGAQITLKLLVDSDSVEVFANGGVLAMTTLAFPKGAAEEISFAGEGNIVRLDFWELP